MFILILVILPIIAILTSILGRKKLLVSETVSFISALLQVFASFYIAYQVLQNSSYDYSPIFRVDSLGAIFIVITSVVGLASVAYNIGYVREEVRRQIIFNRARQSYILINLFLAAMFFAITVANPILTWISVEATTLSTVFLISFYNKPSTIEAAWKYLVINSVGLMLAFLGTIIFLACATPFIQGDFITWQNITSVASSLDPAVIKMAFIFLLIGYGTKVGLVPMHSWLPDAHSQAPTPISAVLSGALLNIALLPILRFKIVTDIAVGNDFTQNLFIFFGAMSVILASLAIFRQENYKRMLAYSSIEHEAVILLGFGFGGLGTFAALLHMIYHSLAKSSMFLLSGNILLKYGSAKVKNVENLIGILPKTTILFIIGFLALTGVPPFGLFLSEFYIILAGIQAHPIVTPLIVFALALIFFGFFKQVSAMVFGKTPGGVASGEHSKWTIIPPTLLLSLLIILSLILPTPLLVLLNNAALMFK